MDHTNKLLFIKKILGSYKFSASTKEALFFCPFCFHYKPKLSINIDSDAWQCFPCGKHGRNLIYLIKHSGTQENINEYIKYYKSSKVKIDKNDNNDFFKLSLPKEFIPLVNCKNSVLGKKIWNYLVNIRGIEEKDILFYKIGTAMNGEYMGKIIFPLFDRRGNLIFYQIRNIDKKFYWNPPVPKGYKNQIVFNELNIDWSMPVVFVEGFIDMLKASGNAIPLLGSFLGKDSKLFQMIVKNKTPVFLALDADAKEKSNKIASNFMHYDIITYNIDVYPYNDLGEMTKQEFEIAFQKGAPLTQNSILRSKLKVVR